MAHTIMNTGRVEKRQRRNKFPVYEARLASLSEVLETNKLNAILILSPENLRYLTGFTGGEGMFLFRRKGGSIIFVDPRYTTQALEEVNSQTIEIREYKKGGERFDRIKEITGRGRLGLESRALTLDLYDELKKRFSGEMVRLDRALDYLRSVKDDGEIEDIKKATEIAGKAFHDVFGMIVHGVVESDVALELEYRIRKGGGEAVSFETIVASGLRAAMPHARASNKHLRPGEVVILDFGVRWGGYCSDETVTLSIGMPSKRLLEIHELVKGASEMAKEVVRPGMNCREIDLAARGYLEERGYERYFVHGIGHGVGLNVHEPPTISRESEDIVNEGMVFTIEPAIYIKGWGGVRLEDMVVVRREGVEVLTSLSKELYICG